MFCTLSGSYCNVLYVGAALEDDMKITDVSYLQQCIYWWDLLVFIMWLPYYGSCIGCPYHFHAQIKVLVLTGKTLYSLGLCYLVYHLALHISVWPLRSNREGVFWVPAPAEVQLVATGVRAFSVIAVHLWNVLPREAHLDQLHHRSPSEGSQKRFYPGRLLMVFCFFKYIYCFSELFNDVCVLGCDFFIHRKVASK